MAELQTISAAGDVAKLAWEVCKFLKKVADADQIAREILKRVTALAKMLDNVQNALDMRAEKAGVTDDYRSIRIAEEVLKCADVAEGFLLEMKNKVKGFETTSSGRNLVERVKLIWGQAYISRLRSNIEACFAELKIQLELLKLTDQAHMQENQAHMQATIDLHHQEMLEFMSNIRAQLENEYELVSRLVEERREIEAATGAENDGDVESAVDERAANDAIDRLADFLPFAEEVLEHYTSSYLPDDRSVELQNDFASEQDHRPGTPRSAHGIHLADTGSSMITNHSNQETDLDDADVDDVESRDVLDGLIVDLQRTAKEQQEQGKWIQAEKNLHKAIQKSELREAHYNVPFTDRVELQELVVINHQSQEKYGEAIARISQLLKETSDPFIQARHNSLLASIYLERYERSLPSLSSLDNDIEAAERSAKRAFKARHELFKAGEKPFIEVNRHDSLILLLVRILHARDETVEANRYMTYLSEYNLSMRRMSTNADDFVVIDKHELLVKAIESSDGNQVQDLLNDDEIDVTRLSAKDKTLLMHAVEASDESIVHQILPRIGSAINGSNSKGISALHLAASLGRSNMVRCLLEHDANVEIRDQSDETPLVKAVRSNQSTIVRMLSDCKAAFVTEHGDDKASPLHFAHYLPREKMLNQLLDLAPELSSAVDRSGKTVLHHCVKKGLFIHASALLTHTNHCDVNKTDGAGRYPIYHATYWPFTPQREKLLRLLMDHGACLDDDRLGPKADDYAILNKSRARRPSRADTVTTVGTSGTVGTTTTASTKLSRIFSRKSNQ